MAFSTPSSWYLTRTFFKYYDYVLENSRITITLCAEGLIDIWRPCVYHEHMLLLTLVTQEVFVRPCRGAREKSHINLCLNNHGTARVSIAVNSMTR